MALMRDSRQTVVERSKCDPVFERALLDEALTLFLNGEPDTARLVLGDLVRATLGFEGLAAATGRPAKKSASDALAEGKPEHGQSRNHHRSSSEAS